MLDSVSAAQLWPLVSPLLSDPVCGVRINAAYLLASAPMGAIARSEREKFRSSSGGVAAQRLNADPPEARSMLGSFNAKRGVLTKAEAEYKAALKLSPQYAPAASNLADLYRRLGRDDEEGERVLRGNCHVAARCRAPSRAGIDRRSGSMTRLAN
jgi:tetratricopeptide (TPR) repeat protein